MEGMTCLDLSVNPIKRGWEHVRPLRQLREVDLRSCGLTVLPEALEGMERMTSLVLGGNPIKSGWEHLRPLTRLQKLSAAVDEENVPEALKALKTLTIVHAS